MIVNNVIEINNVAIEVKEHNGQRLVTFKDIDKVHERLDGTSRKAFNRNKSRFIEGVDYHMVTRNTSMSVLGTLDFNIPPKGLTLLTESGYLMIAKVFDDDLAWEVQRKLVSTYFRAKDNDNVSEVQFAALMAITETLVSLQRDIAVIKDTQQSQQQKQIPKKKFSHWTSKMFPKYQLLMDYFDVSRKELYHNLYMELQNIYPDLDLQQLQDDYCYENNLDSCFTMDVIEHSTKLRQMFELIVNSILEKYHLSSDPSLSTRRETIFDN